MIEIWACGEQWRPYDDGCPGRETTVSQSNPLMNDYCSVGFKEWSVICAALAAGRQSLILRKGGIQEGRDGFRVAHERFWLFPTHYHEAAQSIRADGAEFLTAAERNQAPPGQVRIDLLAVVEQV